MSYTDKDLVDDNRFINRIRYSNGDSVNLDAVESALQDECDSNGIPVGIKHGILKVGGLFNKEQEDVLIVYNTIHPSDYLNQLIRIKHQGKYAFLDTYNVGNSKNRIHSIDGNFSSTRNLINKISGNNQKLEEEENYYIILSDCLKTICG